jgi:hypothetical protein
VQVKATTEERREKHARARRSRRRVAKETMAGRIAMSSEVHRGER